MSDFSGLSALPRLRFAVAGLAILALAAPAHAAPPAKDGRTEAPIAFLYDHTSDAVLFAKQPDLPSPPASMATLMTTELTFRALEAGSLQETDTFRISEDAWRRGGAPSRGSAMFAKLNSQVAVSDLLRGMVVQSGSDAAITLAAGIAGSEPAFAEQMNARAQELGLTRSRFRNATGLPDPEQVMTARDISRLASHLIRAYPARYAMFAEPEFSWNKITQRNRNPLLADYPGADGLKTGFTADSGFGLVGSAKRDGRRLIVVLNGLESAKARAEEARKLLDWGFSAFETKRLFEAGETVAEARVFGGTSRHVPLAADAAVDVLTPKNDDARVIARVVYDGPLTAPVRKGDRVGVLRVWRGEMLSVETPLRAAETVDEGGLGRRAVDGALELVGDWFHQVVARI
ncbi:D-alanyl-D-alanine carboxypeptidase family protein [Methylopila musalis]|uniref:serine-type D-Ala-D-Ala carboxypeptidase n=1 Tax=Methylopila musalis TaxID=1134781 RepID=A0ABW3Z8N4_9HYPH